MLRGSHTLYLVTAAFIAGWWFLAFPGSSPIEQLVLEERSGKVFSSPLLEQLTPFNRARLQQALAGDARLMTELIALWDLEAELLESQGVTTIQRLDRERFLRAQLIGRYLERMPEAEPLGRYLPQTYVASSFLLALASPEEIVAIPRGVRRCSELFPAELTRRIQKDIETCSGEELFQLEPRIAFVANYSNPLMVDQLRKQGVSIKYLNEVNSIEDVQISLAEVGDIVERPLHAELMSIFIQSAIEAMDNHLLALRSAKEERAPRVLYLNYHSIFSTPTSASLIGKLIHRLGINSHFDLLSDRDKACVWRIPLEQESIVSLSPDGLIISTELCPEMTHLILRHAGLMELPAVKTNKVFFVDDTIQQHPTQYIVLAYYDLFQSLMAMEAR